jgi:hypothetical protein
MMFAALGMSGPRIEAVLVIQERRLSIVHWLTDSWCLSRMILMQSAVKQKLSRDRDLCKRVDRSVASSTTWTGLMSPFVSMLPISKSVPGSIDSCSRILSNKSVSFSDFCKSVVSCAR